MPRRYWTWEAQPKGVANRNNALNWIISYTDQVSLATSLLATIIPLVRYAYKEKFNWSLVSRAEISAYGLNTIVTYLHFLCWKYP